MVLITIFFKDFSAKLGHNHFVEHFTILSSILLSISAASQAGNAEFCNLFISRAGVILTGVV